MIIEEYGYIFGVWLADQNPLLVIIAFGLLDKIIKHTLIIILFTALAFILLVAVAIVFPPLFEWDGLWWAIAAFITSGVIMWLTYDLLPEKWKEYK